MASQCTILNVNDQNVAILESLGCSQTSLTFLGHRRPIKFLHVETSFGLISTSQDQTTKLWDLSKGQGQDRKSQQPLVACAALNPQSILALSKKGRLMLWRGSETTYIELLLENVTSMSVAELEPDSCLVLITEPRTAYLYMVLTEDFSAHKLFQADFEPGLGGAVCSCIETIETRKPGGVSGFIGFDQGATCALKGILQNHFTWMGKTELYSCLDTTLQPAEKTSNLRITSVHPKLQVSSAFPRNHQANWTTQSLLIRDNYVIVGTVTGQVQIKDVESRPLKAFQVHQGAITGLAAFNNDIFVTSCEDGSLKMWQFLADGNIEQIGEFLGSGSPVTCLSAVNFQGGQAKNNWGSDVGLVAFGDKAGGLHVLTVKKLER